MEGVKLNYITIPDYRNQLVCRRPEAYGNSPKTYDNVFAVGLLTANLSGKFGPPNHDICRVSPVGHTVKYLPRVFFGTTANI
jgi:hypothetical protein